VDSERRSGSDLVETTIGSRGGRAVTTS